MAIARATGNIGLNTTAPGGSSSVSKAFTNNVASGSLIVVAAWSSDAVTLSCSDNNGGSYSQIVTRTSGTLGQRTSLFRAFNHSAGATTVTITPSSSSYLGICITEYTGADTSSPDDGNNNGGATSSSQPNSGDIVTTTAGLVVCAATLEPSTVFPQVAGSGFTAQYNAATSGSLYAHGYEDQITGASGTYPGIWSANQDVWQCVAMAFKEATGGGGGGGVVPIIQNQFRQRRA